MGMSAGDSFQPEHIHKNRLIFPLDNNFLIVKQQATLKSECSFRNKWNFFFSEIRRMTSIPNQITTWDIGAQKSKRTDKFSMKEKRRVSFASHHEFIWREKKGKISKRILFENFPLETSRNKQNKMHLENNSQQTFFFSNISLERFCGDTCHNKMMRTFSNGKCLSQMRKWKVFFSNKRKLLLGKRKRRKANSKLVLYGMLK